MTFETLTRHNHLLLGRSVSLCIGAKSVSSRRWLLLLILIRLRSFSDFFLLEISYCA